MPDSKQRFLPAAWNLQALTTASIMIKLSQAFIGFMMIHLYVTLFSGATEETTRYCSPLGIVVSSCCGKWCSKKWSKNRGSHTKSRMFWSHQYRAKTRRDKDNIQNKLMQRCHVSSCRCSCPKSPGKQLTFWHTSFCWKSVAAHWRNCKEDPHYILFSLPSCTPFCPVATSPESDWPSGRGWNLATLTNSLPWLKPLKIIIVYQNFPKLMVIWPFILFFGFKHFLLVVHRKLPSGLCKIRLQTVAAPSTWS